MKGIARRIISVLLACMMLAGQLQPAAAHAVGFDGVENGPSDSCAVSQEASGVTEPDALADGETEQLQGVEVTAEQVLTARIEAASCEQEALRQGIDSQGIDSQGTDSQGEGRNFESQLFTGKAGASPSQAYMSGIHDLQDQQDLEDQQAHKYQQAQKDQQALQDQQALPALSNILPGEQGQYGQDGQDAQDDQDGQDAPDGQEAVVITLSGQLPIGADVTAVEELAAAEEAGLTGVLCAYDITINDGWQPEQAVEVSIARDDLRGGVRVYHIRDDGVPEEVEVIRSEEGKIAFLAEGFSVYVVTDDLYRRTYEFMDYRLGNYFPYDFTVTMAENSGNPNSGVFTSNRQILRNGDSLVVPSLLNKDGMRFLGWYTSPDADVNLLQPERGGIKNDITSDSIVTLYARYGWPATITYYTSPEGTQDNHVFSTHIVYLSEEGGSTTVDISSQIHPEAPAEGQGFIGWKKEGEPECVDSQSFTVDGDVALYPCYDQRFEVVFEKADDSEEHIAPVWAGEDGLSGNLSEKNPSRQGYSFAGWAVGDIAITDADGRLFEGVDISFPGGSLSQGVLRLTKGITVHSLWTSLTAQYRVVFWEEKASDTRKLVQEDGVWSVPEDQREYDFKGSLRIPATAGSEVTAAYILEQYSGLAGMQDYALDEGRGDFTGLAFHDVKDSEGKALEDFEIAGDGTTTVHVYYDREIVTYTFDYPDDVAAESAVAEPNYYPALPESGSVIQKAVTSVASVDYPNDFAIIGLYGGFIADGKTEDGYSASWPVSYTASGLSYTLTSRTMEYSGGQWNVKNSSSAAMTESVHVFPTRWVNGDGVEMSAQEIFGFGGVLTPSHRVDNLRQTAADSTVAYYKENEQAAYPASPIYTSIPAISFCVPQGETIVVENRFSGFELDYFTYTDSKGTPIRRENTASQDERTLTGGSFSNLKIYCKRRAHNVYFHNGSSEIIGAVGVKYGMVLSTDYVKQYAGTPSLPPELEGRSEEVEFAGWFLDEECTIYLDFSGLKASGRSELMLRYDKIQMIASVYDFRSPDGSVVPAVRLGDNALHLYAGWVNRRVLVQLEPGGGELPDGVYTFFWKNYGETLEIYPVTRNYVLDNQGGYQYHIHTYDQFLLDKDSSDRSAVYVPASGEDGGSRYAEQAGSYQFLGWFEVLQSENGSEVLKPYDHERNMTESVKLRAQWSRLGSYRVVYDPGAHGSLSGATSSAPYRDNASIALNEDVRADEGYVFTGWRVVLPGTGGELADTLYSSGDEFVLNAELAELTYDEYAGEMKGVITLQAQYEPLKGTSITYYVNGGVFTGPSEESQAMNPDEVNELKERLIRDYGESAVHRYIYDSEGTIIGYSISGIEQNANLTIEDGTWFQRSGYKLMGWSTTPKGQVELELNSGGYHAAADPDGVGHVFYAVWKPEILVTYNLQGGTWNPANGTDYRQDGENWIYSAGNGEMAPVPRSPSKEGYTFGGWRIGDSKKSLAAMPKVTASLTLNAVWTTDVALAFDTKGGTWETLPSDFILLDRNCYGLIVSPKSSITIPEIVPVKDSTSIFYKWEQGAYQYGAGETFKTAEEQAGHRLTFEAIWSEGVPAIKVLVGADDSVTIASSDFIVGAMEDGSAPVSPGDIEGYQYLYIVYDEEPQDKTDITEHYQVTGLRRIGEGVYQVLLANGQTKTHYPQSAEKLQVIYIEDRPVDVCLVRMNVYEDGMDNMNITLTSLLSTPFTTLDVGQVDIQKALPKPKDYAKNGSSNYTSYTYAIGKHDAENMYAIDTMTQSMLWIRQTLNGFAFSVNGDEWKELDREEGEGKDAVVYIIYDNRVETPTNIKHIVNGLKSDKEKLFTYQIYVKGRWGFNIGSAAYFLHKPDDPSEELNSYTLALHDGEEVLIPLHIDWLTNQNQAYSPGDLFYDMFGADYPTTITGRSELRIWQEVEMRRTNELPFENGTFETSIEMSRKVFSGYDTENHLWLKQLGISRFSKNSFDHAFVYTRTSLDVPVHILELTRNGYESRDEDWLKPEGKTISVTANTLKVDGALASELADIPEGYTMIQAQYGLYADDLKGDDQELYLKLAAETDDASLFHVYDYESENSGTRSLVADGSEVYLVFYRSSSSEVPVEYVKKDSSGAYTPIDLDGYGLTAPVVTVTNSAVVDFRSLDEVAAVNSGVRKLEAIYLTGRMLLADQRGSVLTEYPAGSKGDWDSGHPAELVNGATGVIYVDDEGAEQTCANVRVWIEVANNTPLRIIGRMWQRGSKSANTGVIPYLPKDGQDHIVADGSFEAINKDFSQYINYIPYATDPEAEYVESSLGEEGLPVVSAAYCTDDDGYRYWQYKESEDAAAVELHANQILYADYMAHYSPVNVRYVVPSGDGYEDAEELEPLVASTFKVTRDGIMLSDAIGESVSTIIQDSDLYLITDVFILGSADLNKVYYSSDNMDILLTDTVEGLMYQAGDDSGIISGEDYPDVYVALKPVATLTVSKRIEDEIGYARWSDTFTFTIKVDDASFSESCPAVLTCDDSIDHAAAVGPDGSRTVEFEKGKAMVTLKHGQSISIAHIPRDVKVTVVEAAFSGYQASYMIVQGHKTTEGNSFIFDRHSEVEVLNETVDILVTGRDFADSAAYALLLSGSFAYGVYLTLKRRKKARAYR